MFIDVDWCWLMFIDVYWCLFMFIDVYSCLLMFIDFYWCFLLFLDVDWCRLMFFDVYWCFLMFVDVYCCLVMFIDVFWCLLMFIDVYWNMCFETSFTIQRYEWIEPTEVVGWTVCRIRLEQREQKEQTKADVRGKCSAQGPSLWNLGSDPSDRSVRSSVNDVAISALEVLTGLQLGSSNCCVCLIWLRGDKTNLIVIMLAKFVTCILLLPPQPDQCLTNV